MTKQSILMGLKRLLKGILGVFTGRIVSVKFWKRNFPEVALLLFVAMGSIANKYSGQLEMRRISNLESKLEVSQTYFIQSSADYFSKIREKTMRQLVDTLGLDLRAPEQPPYKLIGDGE